VVFDIFSVACFCFVPRAFAKYGDHKIAELKAGSKHLDFKAFGTKHNWPILVDVDNQHFFRTDALAAGRQIAGTLIATQETVTGRDEEAS
jgi:hypothetical protein